MMQGLSKNLNLSDNNLPDREILRKLEIMN